MVAETKTGISVISIPIRTWAEHADLHSQVWTKTGGAARRSPVCQSIPVVAVVLLVVTSAAPATALAGVGGDGGGDLQATTVATHETVADVGAATLETVTADDDCEAHTVGDPPDDPGTDRLGWENGCWADEPLAVTHEDGLNATELRAVASRVMARLEEIRGLEFERDVEVTVRPVRDTDPPVREQDDRNRLFETLFLLDDDEPYAEAVGTRPGGTGFVSSSDEVVLRDPDTESPDVAESLIAHELVHTLQRQHFPRKEIGNRIGPLTDEQIAALAVIEGEAMYLQHRYERRCADDWECGRTTRPDVTGTHPGVFARTAFPYARGMTFVHTLHERGGWEAVDALYEDPENTFPVSTEQVIHPGRYQDDDPPRERWASSTGATASGCASTTAGTPTTSGTGGSDDGPATTTGTDGGGLPGFEGIAALAAIAVLEFLLRRQQGP